MAVSTVRCTLLFAITMATLDYSCCQLAAISTRLPEIITLLENVTDLDWQQNLQKTQNQIANSQNQTASTLNQMANTMNQVASSQSHMEGSLTQIANSQNQTASTLTQIALTQTQMVTTQNEMASSQARMDGSLTQIANSQNQTASTLTQMANSQSQMTTTQTQMANTMNQVASLLQVQSHQLNNITAAMTTMVSLLENQQETLQNMSQSLPLMLKQQENQIELLGRLPIPPRDCSEIAAQGDHVNRPYTITLEDGMGSLTVYCDMLTAGGGWTVFQRRYDGSVDFYLGWNEYEQGFGSPDGEHWMALREIHRLTRNGRWTLRIDMENFDGTTEYAEYESFQLGDVASNYTLSIGSYSGSAGDRLSYHNNQPFSTKDRDHDASSGNCAQIWKGAWWYNGCIYSNLNGLYLGPSGDSHSGMVWYGSDYNSKKKTEMKIRRIQ